MHSRLGKRTFLYLDERHPDLYEGCNSFNDGDYPYRNAEVYEDDRDIKECLVNGPDKVRNLAGRDLVGRDKRRNDLRRHADKVPRGVH